MKYKEVQKILNELDKEFYVESNIGINSKSINQELPDVCSLEIWLKDKKYVTVALAYLEIKDGDEKDFRIKKYYRRDAEMAKRSEKAFIELQKQFKKFLDNRLIDTIVKEIKNGN